MRQLLRICALVMLVTTASVCGAQNIRIQGKVTCEGKPVAGANVSNTQENGSIGTTDESGVFMVLAPRNAQLKITHVAYQEAVVKVKGRQVINVELISNVVELEEVTIVTKVKNKVIPEPTDIEIKGNHFHLHTRFPVPKELFDSNTRLVIQPSIYDHTDKSRKRLKPLVFDGREYALTQTRMYDGELTRDPLAPYITRKTTPGRKSDLLAYHDSTYVEHTGHEFQADVVLSLEDYNRIIYTDSFTIARGTVNPLRMLNFKLEPLPSEEKMKPHPEMQLRDTEGEIELTFRIGRTELDPNNPNNERQIERLAHELDVQAQQTDATLKEVRITGVASPDGYYEANQTLARQRAETALRKLRQRLCGELVEYVKLEANGEVASWDEVARLLEENHEEELLEQLREAQQKARNNRELYQALKSSKAFGPLAKTYLPKLRKVTYRYVYSIFRNLNHREVMELRERGEQLSRYEYFLLADGATNDSLKASYLEEGLKQHQPFAYAANELAQIRIRQGAPDIHLLESYIDTDAPTCILSNQIIALLHHHRAAEALEVWNKMPNGTCNPYLEALVMAFNGHYDDAEPILCNGDPVNEVVFMLARKQNAEALEKVRTLDATNPQVLYLRAIAANRTDEVGEAMMCLQKAIELKPELMELARIDGDVLDLLVEEDNNEMNL